MRQYPEVQLVRAPEVAQNAVVDCEVVLRAKGICVLLTIHSEVSFQILLVRLQRRLEFTSDAQVDTDAVGSVQSVFVVLSEVPA